MSILILRLQGPLQSWGEHSMYWDLCDTQILPTRSGIVGLIGCAMGIPRTRPADLARLSEAIHIGVRADRRGRILTDYQIASSPNLQTAEHGSRENGPRGRATITCYKQYIEDGAFTVAIAGEPAVLSRIAESLQHPVWNIYLGRKGCVPSSPVFGGIYDYGSVREALTSIPLALEADSGKLLLELETGEKGKPVTRQDVPRETQYYRRTVWRSLIPLEEVSGHVPQ